jgi:hypothetical protein
MGLASLSEALREHAGTVETYTSGHLEKVNLLFDGGGLLSGVFKSSWSGCPC